MTPEEEIAQRLMEAISAPIDLQPAIQQAIIGTLARFGAARESEGRRAALRERDAQLKNVLDNLVPHGTSAGRLDLYGQHREECVGDDKNIACVCGLIQSVARFHAALAALRALLEEAGK